MKFLNPKIDRLLYHVDNVEERLKILKSLDSTSMLFDYAELYNWDDGFEIPRAIADHPNCDHGTALLLFWLADPIPYLTGEIGNNEHTKDWYLFCEFMEGRLRTEHYPIGKKIYNPNLTKVQKYKLIKQGVDLALLMVKPK